MPDEIDIDEKFARLHDAIQRDNEADVQDAVFDLGGIRNDWREIPDKVVEGILMLLRTQDMYKSPYAGHVLTFFEFESPRLTDRQKWICIGFLNAHGDEFSDVHSQQVVAELRHGLHGDHLKLKRPSPQQWKDYQRMRGKSGKN